MNSFEDWKGNEIKVGQTIVIMTYKDLFGGSKAFFLIEHKDSHITKTNEFETPHGFRWVVNRKFEVLDYSSNFSFSMDPEIPGKVGMNALCIVFEINSNQVICIEGVSDDEQDFFTNYFNQK